MKLTVKKERLLEMGLPYSALEDNIIGYSRWSVSHEIFFKMDDKFWSAHYSVSATENQDESPWRYTDEVTITQVEKQKTETYKWVPVK